MCNKAECELTNVNELKTRCVTQVFKLLVPHLADVASLNTVYRRHVLDPTRGLAECLALGDRSRGLCVKFTSERLNGMTVQMLDQRQSFSKLESLHAAALHGLHIRCQPYTSFSKHINFV